MFIRHVEKTIEQLSKNYRAITLVGPRQSGKTTLAKKLFPTYDYYTFESPDVRNRFLYDPRGFLASITQAAILDEVQNVPEILSYLQEILDDKNDGRTFVLTGSNNLKLSHNVSQTLAGRTKILHVLPLMYNELPPSERKKTLDEMLLFGGYPRIYDENLDPTQWLGDYFQTYIEKDIRSTINITDLTTFDRFIRLLAGRAGQLINYNSLGSDAGITQPTAKAWVSALETTFICFTLPPHFKNFNKRIIKAPKVYFYDVGLLCYLLRIGNTDQLSSHPLRGFIFENWVISEYMKQYWHQGILPPLYFWRDQHGHEIDLVIDQAVRLDLIEVKAGKTFQKEFLNNIHWLNKLQNKNGGLCIYGGDQKFTIKDVEVVPWKNIF